MASCVCYFYTDNDNYSSYEKKDQWPQQFIKEINDLNANMEMQLGNALNTDIMYLRKKYKDWGCSGTEPTSKSDAINRAFDLHRNVTKGLSTLSREVIDNLIMQDTALHVLINWLNGFHTIARKYMKTDMDIDANYVLFVKQVFPDPYSARIGQQVHLNKKSVIVSGYNQQTALSLDNTYDLVIRPVMANGDTHTYVDQKDFMSLTKDWGLRNDWVRIFIAFNMFNLGQVWVEEWGERMRLSNSGPGLFRKLSESGYITTLLKYLTEFTDVLYSQAQFETIIEELTGERPDMSVGSKPDVSKSNETRAVQQMPFLDPNDTNPLGVARTVVPQVVVKTEDYDTEDFTEEQAIDMHAPPKKIRRSSEREETYEPAPKRRRPAAVVEEESQTGLYIAALVGILALAMY